MNLNLSILSFATFCYYFALAHLVQLSTLQNLNVALPEAAQVENVQYRPNYVSKDNVVIEKRADVEHSGEIRLDDRINRFFEDLEGFTVMELFRFASFATESPRLDRELTEIARLVKALPVPDPILSNKVQFAHIVFQEMKYASEIHKSLLQNMNINELLLRDLLQTYLSLFKYRNLDGSPNPLKHDYGIWLHSLSVDTEERARKFGVANETPIALRLLFDRQLVRIRTELQALKSAIADDARVAGAVSDVRPNQASSTLPGSKFPLEGTILFVSE